MLKATFNDGAVVYYDDKDQDNWQIKMKIENGRIVKLEKTVGKMTVRELANVADQYLDITDMVIGVVARVESEDDE